MGEARQLQRDEIEMLQKEAFHLKDLALELGLSEIGIRTCDDGYFIDVSFPSGDIFNVFSWDNGDHESRYYVRKGAENDT